MHENHEWRRISTVIRTWELFFGTEAATFGGLSLYSQLSRSEFDPGTLAITAGLVAIGLIGAADSLRSFYPKKKK